MDERTTPPADETSDQKPRRSRRQFLGVMATAGVAVTGVGVGAAATKLGVLPAAAGAPMGGMDPRHPTAGWTDKDFNRVRPSDLIYGKPDFADPLVYGSRGHDPREGGDPERHRLLALMGTLKRAWEYPALMQSFDRDAGRYLKSAAPDSGVRLNDDDIVRLLQLPESTDVGKVSRPWLASTLGLKSPLDDAPHVVFTLLRVLHVHPLISAECK